MLKRKHKLSRRQFDAVFKSKKTLHTEHFFVKWTENEVPNRLNISVVISKKVEKQAGEQKSFQTKGLLRNFKASGQAF